LEPPIAVETQNLGPAGTLFTLESVREPQETHDVGTFSMPSFGIAMENIVTEADSAITGNMSEGFWWARY
jgi:hypothetical protein